MLICRNMVTIVTGRYMCVHVHDIITRRLARIIIILLKQKESLAFMTARDHSQARAGSGRERKALLG